MENQAKTIAKQANIDFWGRVFGKILGYLYILVLTNLLTPDQYGVFRILLSITSIASTFAILGLTGVLDRYIPAFLVNREYGKIKSLIKKVFGTSLWVGITLSVLIFFLSPFVVNLFKVSGLRHDFVWGLKVMSITIPVMAASQLIYYVFVSYKKLFYPVLIENICQPFVRIVAAGGLVFFSFRLLPWAFAYTTIAVIICLYSFYYIRKNLLSWWYKTAEVPIDTEEILSYTWPLSASTVLGLLMAQIMPLLLGFYRPPHEVAVFTIYFATISVLLFMENSVAKIFKPVASENGQLLLKETGILYKRVARWAVLFAGAALVITALYGKEFIVLLFPQSYLLAPGALVILAIGFFIGNITGPTSALLESQNKTKLLLGITTLHILIIITLSVLLIPKYGLVGAAITFSSSYSIINIAAILIIQKKFMIHPFSRKFMNAFIVLLVFGAIGWLIKSILAVSIGGMIIALIIFIPIFFGLIYIFKAYDSDDLFLIKGFLPK